jgi:hypothetical protein
MTGKAHPPIVPEGNARESGVCFGGKVGQAFSLSGFRATTNNFSEKLAWKISFAI